MSLDAYWALRKRVLIIEREAVEGIMAAEESGDSSLLPHERSYFQQRRRAILTELHAIEESETATGNGGGDPRRVDMGMPIAHRHDPRQRGPL